MAEVPAEKPRAHERKQLWRMMDMNGNGYLSLAEVPHLILTTYHLLPVTYCLLPITYGYLSLAEVPHLLLTTCDLLPITYGYLSLAEVSPHAPACWLACPPACEYYCLWILLPQSRDMSVITLARKRAASCVT